MKHRDRILELRSKGMTYNEIVKELGCSKAVVAYHCGEGQKQKTYKRKIKFKQKSHPYLEKIYRFFARKAKYDKIQSKIKSDLRKQIRDKLYDFYKRGNKMDDKLTLEQVIEKFGEKPKCYLTGDDIDIYKPSTYEFDHIIPASRGGNNSIENLGICSRKANQSKRDMTPDELECFCKKVLEHRGYQVINRILQAI